MKVIVTLFVLLLSFTPLTWADKPEWAGEGKPTDEQKAEHKDAMTSKHDDRGDNEDKKDKDDRDDDDEEKGKKDKKAKKKK